MSAQKSLLRLKASLILLVISLFASGCVQIAFAAPPLTPTPSPRPSATPTPSPTPDPGPTQLPEPVCAIRWVWRENGLVVTDVNPSSADGLAVGDRILSIDGRDLEEVLAQEEARFVNEEDLEARRALALSSLLTTRERLVLRVKHLQTPAYTYILWPDCRF